MASKAIHTFELNGREFLVLWKESATYLRADGRMWWSAHGLSQDEAIHLCCIQAEILTIEERAGEVKQLHRLFLTPHEPDVAGILDDYECFTLPVQEVRYVVVWAPFNQNTYVCLADGWHFVDTATSHETATTAVVDFLTTLPLSQKQPGDPARDPARTLAGPRPRWYRLGRDDSFIYMVSLGPICIGIPVWLGWVLLYLLVTLLAAAYADRLPADAPNKIAGGGPMLLGLIDLVQRLRAREYAAILPTGLVVIQPASLLDRLTFRECGWYLPILSLPLPLWFLGGVITAYLIAA